MTREDVKKIFPDATDEQITSFLNQSNSDVAKEKAKNQKLKEDAEKEATGKVVSVHEFHARNQAHIDSLVLQHERMLARFK